MCIRSITLPTFLLEHFHIIKKWEETPPPIFQMPLMGVVLPLVENPMATFCTSLFFIDGVSGSKSKTPTAVLLWSSNVSSMTSGGRGTVLMATGRRGPCPVLWGLAGSVRCPLPCLVSGCPDGLS